MPDSEKFIEEKLLKIYEEAILDEQTSAARYRHALQYAKNDEVKQMFERLIEDEENHERILKERYYEIKKRLGMKVMKDK